MFKLIAPRDLGPVPAAAATTFLALAIFAWTERTVLVDPDHMSVPYWPWKLWHLGALAVTLPCVWWLWFSTRRVPWVRSLALGLIALAILTNAYTDLFGSQYYPVWRTINPLFISCSTIAAFTLWRLGSPEARVAALLSAGVGGLLAANFYWADNAIVWDMLYPLSAS